MSNAILIQTDSDSYGAASLFQNGDTYQLEDVSSGSTVTLTYQNNAATTEWLGPWHAVGAIRTQNGYEVAFKNVLTGQFTAWYTDLNGNFLNGIAQFGGKSVMLYNLEKTFNQDLNWDGSIGTNSFTNVIQTDTNAYGALSVTQQTNQYLFSNPAGDIGSGGELSYGGSLATTDWLGSWHVIGAALTATGYEVAFKNVATGQFTAWYTDRNGNYTGSTDVFSANSPVLEQLETSFNQDLNGDGTIGLPAGTSLIQTDKSALGSTSLVQVGNTYYLENADTGAGPVLQYGNSAVTTDGLGTWHAIGAVQTSAGYEVAFKNSATGAFSLWNTDSNGNYTSDLGTISAHGLTVQALESVFGQNFNGDGKIGLLSGLSLIQIDSNSYGVTSLFQVGDTYRVEDVSTGVDKQLNFQGREATTEGLGSWHAIGAVKSAAGYEVAFENVATGQFTAWYTDVNNNYTGGTDVFSANSQGFLALETTFNQDLNGDGKIGLSLAANHA